ncbi:hypothetical protein PT2222_40414 [Paraburkholderia tropica]
MTQRDAKRRSEARRIVSYLDVVPWRRALARAAHAPQFVEHQQGRADADRAVRDVERRPVRAAQMEVQEVDHVAVHQAVEHVAERAAQNERKRRAEHALARVTLEQIADHQRGHDAQRRERPALPAAGRREEAERRALVVDQHEVEERRDHAAFAVCEHFGDGDLGELIREDHDHRDAEPRRERAAHAIRLHLLRHGLGHYAALRVSPLPNRLATQRPHRPGCSAFAPTSSR